MVPDVNGRLVGASLGGKFTSKAMLTVASGVGILFIILAFICPITTMVSMPVFKSDISFGVAQVPISIMFMGALRSLYFYYVGGYL